MVAEGMHNPTSEDDSPMRKIHVNIGKQYADLFWPEFVSVDGLVFLRSWCPGRLCEQDTRYPTQTESDMSHTHVFDVIRHKAGIPEEPSYDERHADFVAAYELGRTICRMWAAKLLLDFPQDDFRVYLHGFDPIVRFHKVRDGEPNWVEQDQCPESIKSGKTMIIDTRDLKRRVKGGA